MQIIELIGRILLGGFFIMSGVNHFTKMKEMISYATTNKLPLPKAGVMASGVLMILGGLGVVFWVFPMVAISLLALFMLVVSFTMHRFWSMKNASPEVRVTQMRFFMGNMALFSALLIIISMISSWL